MRGREPIFYALVLYKPIMFVNYSMVTYMNLMLLDCKQYSVGPYASVQLKLNLI
jgi:hypothetical protein